MTLRTSRRTEFIRRVRAKACTTQSDRLPSSRGSATEGPFIHTSLQVGKYLVSPLTRLNDGGRYQAAVSIRSGRGSMTHDRVMRFVPVFDSHAQAARFATEQALAWIGEPAAASRQPHLTQE